MNTTLISHFYNEEYLLPWWLMHHTKLFNHGILINRGSTDRSVEICKLFAPHWEIRDSKVLEFDAILVDQEVMNIEQEITGWKMVLNTTEFLCCSNKEEFFSSLTKLKRKMYSIRTILMVDDPMHAYTKPRYGIPLVKQRFHGIVIQPSPLTIYNGGRLIHNYSHGNYSVGRHNSFYSFTIYKYPAFILKFFYSPWNNAMKDRKLQIGPTLSKHSAQNGLGTHHLVTLAKLEENYLHYANLTSDLRLMPEYQLLFPGLCFPNY
ncbi:TPA: glycosyltransferase family 2 protein [Bacillus toyonensis]|uniref:glycosyltransferase family 2 protein n=1 Tax=Bacillus toyonensis TaxID=155322 RepID=UPI003302CAAF|nr:glycosyltransferase family 2 protein [Bacillus toyonensis]